MNDYSTYRPTWARTDSPRKGDRVTGPKGLTGTLVDCGGFSDALVELSDGTLKSCYLPSLRKADR
jgi:hypothetical protein